MLTLLWTVPAGGVAVLAAAWHAIFDRKDLHS